MAFLLRQADFEVQARRITGQAKRIVTCERRFLVETAWSSAGLTSREPL